MHLSSSVNLKLILNDLDWVMFSFQVCFAETVSISVPHRDRIVQARKSSFVLEGTFHLLLQIKVGITPRVTGSPPYVQLNSLFVKM